MTIRTVFFDLGGTLLVMRRNRIISVILTEAGYPASADAVLSAYYRTEPSWLTIYAERKISPEETEEAYRKLDVMVFRALFPASAEAETGRVSRVMQERWGEVEKSIPRELYPDTMPTLVRLREDGYTLGVISNAPPDTRGVIESMGLGGFFRAVVISGVVGVSKPNPQTFRTALEAAKSSPEESVHVGDVYAADIIGARNAGIKGVLIDRNDEGRGFDCPRIKELGEVYGFLE